MELVEYFLKKKGIGIGDYVEILLTNGLRIKGLVMPKHEFSKPDILIVKLENGYNIGINVSKIVEIEKTQFSVKSRGITLREEVKKREKMPRVLILGVGGTILSKVDYVTGGVKSAVSVDELLSILPEVADIAEIETDIIMNKYSEHLTPDDWSIIARRVYSEIVKKKYSGIVILHGTDTLAYTAAALSFSLQQLPIPVVLVGSQRSSDRPSSDAALNLISAIRVAAYSEIAEVVVALHSSTSDNLVSIHQGTRVRKVHTSRRDAFQSIDVLPYMMVDYNGNMYTIRSDYRRRGERQPLLYPKFSRDAYLVKFYPGFNKNILLYLLHEGAKAIILEGTGLGHVGEYLYETIRTLIKDGVRIYMTSQCIWGRVNMNVYDTGRILKKMGVIQLDNMLSEVAYVKASWILGNFGESELDTLMLSNIAGEITPKSPYLEYGESSYERFI
ncbi:MAG: Glu-tRNA(Gln) amidotransferase subunit GatD [Candidatus Geothermarchaeota archaeon]